MKKKVLAILLAASMLTFAACGDDYYSDAEIVDGGEDVTVTDTTVTEEPATEDQGVTEDDPSNYICVTIDVLTPDGAATYEVTTLGATVYDAMCDLASDEVGFSFDGYDAQWGYYVTTVNGLYADYDNEGTYWSFTINDEYSMDGVDAATIQSGDVIALEYVAYTGEDVNYESSETGTAVTIEVVTMDNTTSYEVVTDGTTVYEAMQDLAAADSSFTYDGSQSEYGFYLTTVNGVLADYNTDGTYWSLLVNGEYAEYGVETTEIQSGDVITLEQSHGY